MGSVRSVLVVDDDVAMRDMVVSLLREAGFDVVVAMGADDALAELQGRYIGAVLSDIRMPGKSGFDRGAGGGAEHPRDPDDVFRHRDDRRSREARGRFRLSFEAVQPGGAAGHTLARATGAGKGRRGPLPSLENLNPENAARRCASSLRHGLWNAG